MKKRFMEEQIIRILKEYEGGEKEIDIIHEPGISEQTFMRLPTSYGGNQLIKMADLPRCFGRKQDRGTRHWGGADRSLCGRSETESQ